MANHRAPRTTEKEKSATLERFSAYIREAFASSSAVWDSVQRDYVLDIFRAAARHIPAYRHFLKERGVIPRSIKTIEDFKRVPPVSKKNYLRKYAWEKLVSPGAIAGKPLVLTATSGSTGKPFYFPRVDAIDEQSYVYHREFLKWSLLDPAEPTIVIVAFGMGVWIGGIITYEAFGRISKRDFPVTVLTAGVNKKEIYDALLEIGGEYSQLVLCGYPPFIKDVIDDGGECGVDWRQFDMRIVCAAEAFSEDFRDYLLRETGMTNAYRDIMNIYGSAELGTMATETPLSILLRRLSLMRPSLYKKLFSEATRLPTLAQYIPSFVSFESVDNRIYCTAGNALPLVRYEIGDHGGVFSYAQARQMCATEGIDLMLEARTAGIADTVRELPFVYVYERADLSTKLYGAIIYPEHVRHGLHAKELEPFVTGKFTMFTRTDEKQDEYLEINAELKAGVRTSARLVRAVADAIVSSLLAKNAEYGNNARTLGERVRPKVFLLPHGHPEHFAAGVKHRWVRNA